MREQVNGGTNDGNGGGQLPLVHCLNSPATTNNYRYIGAMARTLGDSGGRKILTNRCNYP